MSTLDRYLKEREEQSPIKVKELQVEESPQLEEIIQAYETWLQELNQTTFNCTRWYENAIPLISDIGYSAKDVYAFSLLLEKHRTHALFRCSGLFISALVNEGVEQDYTILTEHLVGPLNSLKWLGYHNTKNLTIIGDVGDYAGERMSDGNLDIIGNADYRAGYRMSGGILTIHGDTAECAGERMSGGTITINGSVTYFTSVKMSGGNLIVKGDAGRVTGGEMTGGTLDVTGVIESIANTWNGGQIYEGGKLVRGTEEKS